MRIAILFFALLFTSAKAVAEIHPLSASAQLQFDNKDYESALLAYNQLIQEFPERKEGYFNRGLCLFKTEKFSEAIFDFDEAFSIDTLLDEAQLMKGFSLEKRGDLKEAITQYTNLSVNHTNYKLLSSRIKNYQLAVLVSKRWYYMIGIFLIAIILITVVVKSLSYKKG